MAIRFLPYAFVIGAAALEARRERTLSGVAGLVPVLRISQGFVLMGFLMTTWWEHHLVFLLVPYFFALRIVMVEPLSTRVAAVLVALSTFWVALGRHPLVWDWALAGDHPIGRLLWRTMLETKRIGILLLLVTLELLIAQLKRSVAESKRGASFEASGLRLRATSAPTSA